MRNIDFDRVLAVPLLEWWEINRSVPPYRANGHLWVTLTIHGSVLAGDDRSFVTPVRADKLGMIGSGRDGDPLLGFTVRQ